MGGVARVTHRALWLAIGLLWLAISLPALTSEGVVRFGLFTDLHAHDLDSPGERKWMSHTEERLLAFVAAMNEWGPEFVVELGDFVNGWVVLGAEPLGSPDRIPDILAWARDLVRQFDGPVYHVIGNHDVYNLDKRQYKEILGLESTSYSFDVGDYHFIVLDVQYNEDGTDLAHTYTGVAGYVPDELLNWLREDLAATDRPTLLFVHQPLDDYMRMWGQEGRPTVLNRDAVQQVLAEAGQVIAVFQGHAHRNVYNLIDGIHYVTFAALVDQNTPPSWARVTLDPVRQRILIDGVGTQDTYDLSYSLHRTHEDGTTTPEEAP